MKTRPIYPGILAALAIAGCAAERGLAPPNATPPSLGMAHQENGGHSRGDVLLASGGGPAKVYCLDETSCYAVAFEFTDYESDPETGHPYTIFTAYFQNLQGTYPSDGPATPLRLNLFHLQFFESSESPNYVDAYHMELSAVGNVVAGSLNEWNNDSPTSGINSDLWVATGFGIVGCDWALSPGALPTFAFQTCPSDGVDGWVKVDFYLRRGVLKTPVRFHDFVFSFGRTGGIPPGPFCKVGIRAINPCTVWPYRRVVR